MILGGGFAGMTTARHLERLVDHTQCAITLVSRDNYALFTPMLPEVSSGGIETRHVVTPLRPELPRTSFVLGDVAGIDLERKRVSVVRTLEGTSVELGYDQLVIALGSVSTTFGLPGVAENTLPLKTLDDAEILRNRIIATLELADSSRDPAERRRLLTYVFVGGGYTGVEAAGELIDFFKSILAFYPSIDRREVDIVLIEGSNKLLPELPPKMGAYTQRNLERRGVRVMLGDLVASVDADGITLRSGARVDASTIVWSAGVRPTPLVAHLPVEHSRIGAILTNPDLSVPNFPGVWAIGDCASIPISEGGGAYPMTAQHALREGPLLAHNIAATLAGKPTKPFHFEALGTMASLGGRKAVAAVLRNRLILTGIIAWFVWRTYYLLRIPGLDRKFRVAFDWFVGLLFPRDIAELRVFTEQSEAATRRDAGMRPAPPPQTQASSGPA